MAKDLENSTIEKGNSYREDQFEERPGKNQDVETAHEDSCTHDNSLNWVSIILDHSPYTT